MSTTASAPAKTLPEHHYLNATYGIRSWLLTVDHKRIALLYLVSVTFFFFIGGFFAMMIRLHLLTPSGYLLSADTYNRMFTMHGVAMIFFFLIPVHSCRVGEFLYSADDRRERPGLPEDQSFELVYLCCRRRLYALFDGERRIGHRLDLLHALKHRLLELGGRARGDRRLHHRLLLDPDRLEFPGHRFTPCAPRA